MYCAQYLNGYAQFLNSKQMYFWSYIINNTKLIIVLSETLVGIYISLCTLMFCNLSTFRILYKVIIVLNKFTIYFMYDLTCVCLSANKTIIL